MASPADTVIELARWRSQLKEHRQPWPEWEQLEQLVDQAAFKAESDRTLPFPSLFLASAPDGSGNRFIHSVMTAKQEKQFIALSPSLTGFPSYLIPLLDLKYSDTYMMAGGLANHVCTYDTKASFELPSPVGPEACRAQPHMIQYQDLSKIRWPKMITYPLQANSSGGVFFVNAEAEVSSFSVESQGFARIGHLPDFVRYCLASVIKRQDWFVNYQRGHLLNEFGLLHVRDAGID